MRNGKETLNKIFSSRLVKAIFLMFFSSLSHTASVDKVINIESDSFEFYPQEEKVEYKGSVKTSYQGITLQSERLEATLQDATISALIAYGDPALIKTEHKTRNPELIGTAATIKLINESDIVELSDQATLAYGKSRISSSFIRFNIRTGSIIAGEAGTRVSMTLKQSELE